MKLITSLVFIIGLVTMTTAQNQDNPSPIIFIYDASGSMWGQIDGKTKMNIATTVLTEAVNKLPAEQRIGLVAYGHRKKGDCEDVEFLAGVENRDKSSVIQSLKSIKPLGKTPLAFSALQVIDQLRKNKTKASIILVTDGIESCGGDLCAVIKAAKKEGIDFRLHIIGFGLKDSETDELKCAANAGDGKYYDAADAGGLTDGLNEATEATVDKPVGNVTLYAIKNGKPIDAYVKAYPAGTKEGIAAARTYADTATFYLPPGKYDLEVRPLENSDVAATVVPNVESFQDKVAHQTVSFDAGKIEIMTNNNGEGWDATVSVFVSGQKSRAAGSRTYGRLETFDLNPGVYDLEIQALQIKGLQTKHRIENIEVKAGATASLEHNFESGELKVGASSAAGLVDATVNVVEVQSNKNVAAGRTYTSPGNNPRLFILSPGTYKVTLRALKEHAGKKETFTIEVKAGETKEKIVNF